MNTLAKVLLGLTAGYVGYKVLASSGGRAVSGALNNGVATPRGLYQGDPRWNRTLVGNSALTCGNVGCGLTSLTMAANAFHGTNLTPDQANDIIKASGGGFDGPNLFFPAAAAALRMSAPESKRIRFAAHAALPTLRGCIDETLAAGGLAIIDISYDGGANHAHFILCYARDAQGNYLCKDPARPSDSAGHHTDQPTKLPPDLQTMAGSKQYTGEAVIPLFPA